MRKFRAGELYYYGSTKSIVKILENSTSHDSVLVEVVFTDGFIVDKGYVGYCHIDTLRNKYKKTIILSL